MPYDPRLMLKILLYGYCTGIRSSRQLEKQCVESLPFRYLTRSECPCFRTLCAARTGLEEELKLCFLTMAASAEKVGMKRVGRITIDSTKIRADVSSDSIVREKDFESTIRVLEEILKEAQIRDSKEDSEGYDGQTHLDREIGTDQMRETLRHVRKVIHHEKTGDNEPPGERLALGPEMKPKLEKAVKDLKEAAQEERSYISLTDPDANMMREGRDKHFAECHSFEVAIDSGILVVAQTTQCGTDNSRLPVIVAAAKEQEPNGVLEVMADSGYFDGDNIVDLENAAIATCIPSGDTACDLRKGLPVGTTRDGKIGKGLMAYDPEHNWYICEQGEKLTYESKEHRNGKDVLIYKKRSDCTDCPIKERCMTRKNVKRRVLHVPADQNQIKEILNRFQEEEHRKRYWQRAPTVETIFAFIRRVLNFKRWSVRGKEKVEAEAQLLRASFQLRKLHTALTA
jgi:hypothetical protein